VTLSPDLFWFLGTLIGFFSFWLAFFCLSQLGEAVKQHMLKGVLLWTLPFTMSFSMFIVTIFHLFSMMVE